MKKHLLLMTLMLLVLSTINAQKITFSDIASAGTLGGKEFTNGDLILKVTDTGGKCSIDASPAYFGTSSTDTISFNYRLKPGGASSTYRYLTLTIPADGTLKIYARSSSSSATDRNIILTQNGNELLNHVVLESESVLAQYVEGVTTTIYTPLTADVSTGTVDITFPTGGVNFYGFEFIQKEQKQWKQPTFTLGSYDGDKYTLTISSEENSAIKYTVGDEKETTSASNIQTLSIAPGTIVKASVTNASNDFFKIDFRTNPYTVVLPATGLPSGVIVDAGTFQDAQHGAKNAAITVQVEGPTKFTLGGCSYGTNATVSVDGGNAQTIDTKTAGCDGNFGTYTKFANYTYNEEKAAILTFNLGNYSPYFFAEKIYNDSGYNDSEEATYTVPDAPVLSQPTFTLDSWDGEKYSVTISSEDDSTIKYSVDSEAAITSSTNTIVISAIPGTVIKAIATRTGYTDSKDTTYTVPEANKYAVEAGKTYTTGEEIKIWNVTCTIGEGATASSLEGYNTNYVNSYYTQTIAGSNNPTYDKTSGIPSEGTYYTFTSNEDGQLEVGLKLNANKTLVVSNESNILNISTDYIFNFPAESGGASQELNSYGQFDNASRGIIKFTVSKNTTYYIYAIGSKLGLQGFTFTPKQLYNITYATCDNGTISGLPAAQEGQEVTLTTNPAFGYQLSNITVKDSENNDITVADNKFTMPANDVTVSATFSERNMLSQTSISKTTTWDWTKAATSTVTLPVVSEDGWVVLANLNGMTNDETFNSQALAAKCNTVESAGYAFREISYPYFQAQDIKFVTTVPGKVYITAANITQGTTIKMQYCNDTEGNYTDIASLSRDESGNITFSDLPSFGVVPGDVEIHATGGVRISKIIFTPNNNVSICDADWSTVSSISQKLKNAAGENPFSFSDKENLLSSSRITTVDGNVTALDLSGLGFVGSVPSELNNLTSMTKLDLSNNSFTDFEALPASTITSLNLSNQTFVSNTAIDFSSITQAQLMSLVPPIFLYDHNSQSYKTDMNVLLSSASTLDEALVSSNNFCAYLSVYNSGKDMYIYNYFSDPAPYSGQSGDTMNMLFYNDNSWSGTASGNMSFKLNFSQGDANFLGGIDASDLQATILYTFDEYETYPFNFTAADTYKDSYNRINVQDVICTVNLLLAEEGSSSAAKDLSGSRIMPQDTQLDPTEATIFVRDGKVILSSTIPVAALTVKADGAVNWDIESYGLTQSTTDRKLVGYSLGGTTIPAGETVIGTCMNAGTTVNEASLSDVAAKTITVSVDNDSATAIDNVEGTVIRSGEIYDVTGRKHTEMQNGLNIIKRNGDFRKVIK